MFVESSDGKKFSVCEGFENRVTVSEFDRDGKVTEVLRVRLSLARSSLLLLWKCLIVSFHLQDEVEPGHYLESISFEDKYFITRNPKTRKMQLWDYRLGSKKHENYLTIADVALLAPGKRLLTWTDYDRCLVSWSFHQYVYVNPL
jgi:hypothetical protein